MKALILAAAVVLAGAASGVAQPMPTTRPAPQSSSNHLVQQVDYACGPGWRLNRWGDCVPRRGPPPRPRYWRDDGPPRHWGPPPRHWRDRGPDRHWGPPPRW
ncbi:MULTISPECIES: GCG_CRPN prefix-to-repeats domain-containing protein [unclassified Rhizobium]|uniref:GCG_CRPN prefix-to-repeats domain-containing protein n=1 Tax=unclassified Rhizobium TaxID=2613769 RepID=UPI003D2B94CF